MYFLCFYVAVYEINNEDVDALMKSLQVKSSPAVNDGVVRLRGLPYSCNEKDIVDFFAGAFRLYHVYELYPVYISRSVISCSGLIFSPVVFFYILDGPFLLGNCMQLYLVL